MAISVDPENNETRALFDLADFRGQHVLEIGCGDGRLTWRYAPVAAHIIAIDPKADRIALAGENIPHELRNSVEFHGVSIENFAQSRRSSLFDSVILSWSL